MFRRRPPTSSPDEVGPKADVDFGSVSRLAKEPTSSLLFLDHRPASLSPDVCHLTSPHVASKRICGDRCCKIRVCDLCSAGGGSVFALTGSIRGGHSKRFCLRFWRDSGLILHRIGGVKFGPSLTTPLCSEGILDAILHVDGSGWLVQAEAEAEAAILEPNAPPESLLQKRRF